ncbi:MAG: DUF2156 domain-containing protein, partial [Armatimonadota bacterium]|nr:DUF2156 domain-containing protein [Armatimonadota bacterium]
MGVEIPNLPEMRPLGLEDREALAGMFSDLRPRQSEFTFTNLFVWREAHELRLSRVGTAVAVFSWRADPEDSFVLPPLGPGANAEVVRGCLEHMGAAGHSPRMARATRDDVGRLEVRESEFSIEADRDQFDYVYLVRDLIELSGNRYHGKRNHLEQFTRRHDFAYRPLTR